MHIRQANIHDFTQIMELYGEASDAMAGTPYDCCWRRDGHPVPDFVRGLITNNVMLVAEEDGNLIGAVGCDHDLGHDYEGCAWLTNVPDELVSVIHLLVIRMDQRGKGLSRTLLNASLEQATAKGMRTARLDATANNAPAIALYQSEGFEIVGKGDLDVNPDGDSLIPFVVMERPL
jgi:ribosomal protein S18 acetylase RimI-like enzyme